MYETLSKQELNAMTSDAYKAAFEGANGDDFRKRVSELENQPAPAGRKRGSVRGEEASPSAPTQGFDPSFDDAPTAAPDFPAVAPVVEPAPVATKEQEISELPLREHSYQPMVNGKAAGGLQKFKYRTVNDPNDPNSLVLQLQKAHSYASAKIRQLSRDRKLGEITDAGVEATKVPRPNALPKNVTLEELAQQNYILSVRSALSEFKLRCPEYVQRYVSDENAQALILHVQKRGDETSPESYIEAFQWAVREGVIEPVVAAVPAPVVVAAVPASASAPVAAVPAPAPEPARRTYGIPTGLSSLDGGEDNTPAAPLNAAPSVGIVINGTRITSIAQWDRLSADAQKKALRNPSLAAIVNQMYDQQAQEATARRGR
jgi:hypothetical protein